MNWVYIRDLKKHVGQEVLIKGWVYNTRSSSKNIKLSLIHI